MAEAGPSTFKPPRKELTLECCFSYDLMQYALTEYDLKTLFIDTQAYKQNILTTKVKDSAENFKKEKHRSPNKKEMRRIDLKFRAEPPSPFCIHIGEAILALSHLNRIYFKLKFDSMFPVFIGHTEIRQFCVSFTREHYKNGYLSEFLFMYAFMVELCIYLALRETMGYTSMIWDCFDLVYSLLLKKKFLERGGWKELRRAARPWWHCYRRAKANGINFRNPEFVYFNQQLAGEPLSRYPFVGGGNYIDEGHPDDIPKPKRELWGMSPDDEQKLACSKDACFYFCLVKELPNRSAKTESENVASAVLATCSKGSGQTSSLPISEKSGQASNITEALPGTSGGLTSTEKTPRATASQIIAVRTPEVVNHRPSYVAPPGYLPRSKIDEVYFKGFEKVKKELQKSGFDVTAFKIAK